MASNLGRYLPDLATNPQKVRELQEDPDSAMDQAQLTVEERQILRRANPDEIRRYLQREDPHLTRAGVPPIVVAIF
jgi:hypothetical protein